ncbi:hypothetical protein ACNSPR_29620 [Klebsiella pneumoniae]
MLAAASGENFELPEYASGRILSFRATPGMPLQAVQALLDLQPQALILECYGAGNLPDNDPALLDMLARANDAGIVLLACSQTLHGEVALGAYATGSGLALRSHLYQAASPVRARPGAGCSEACHATRHLGRVVRASGSVVQ